MEVLEGIVENDLAAELVASEFKVRSLIVRFGALLKEAFFDHQRENRTCARRGRDAVYSFPAPRISSCAGRVSSEVEKRIDPSERMHMQEPNSANPNGTIGARTHSLVRSYISARTSELTIVFRD